MLFNEIDYFIKVYNNLVIELVQCFGTSFFGRIDHLASSVIKFRPKKLVPKHCTSSITYNYGPYINIILILFLVVHMSPLSYMVCLPWNIATSGSNQCQGLDDPKNNRKMFHFLAHWWLIFPLLYIYLLCGEVFLPQNF